MKKFINTAYAYAIAALIYGVFYREFTKINGFTGRTALGFGHVHLFALGTLLFLLIALFTKFTTLTEQKAFGKFFILYNIALPAMMVMFLVRGITEVLGTNLTKTVDASISGIAGITHIMMAVAIVFFFTALRKSN